jgi:WD40 repeat protein
MTTGEPSVINEALWGSLNHTIISCGEDGKLRVWDTEVCIVTVIITVTITGIHHTPYIQ